MTFSTIFFLLACLGLAYIALDIATDIARKVCAGYSLLTMLGGPLCFTYIMGYIFIS